MVLNREIETDNYSDFLGIAIGKKAKARKDSRKTERRQSNLEKITARNAPKMLLAQQGIVQPSEFAQGITGVASLVGSVLGKGSSTQPEILGSTMGDQSEMEKLKAQIADLQNTGGTNVTLPEDDNQTPFNKKNLPYIIGGVLLVVVVIVVLLKRKK